MEIKRCYFANAHESIGIVIAFWFFALLKPLNEFQIWIFCLPILTFDFWKITI